MIDTKVSLSAIILFAVVMPEQEEQITVNLLNQMTQREPETFGNNRLN